MILADTSVWVEHLRAGVPELVVLLSDGRIVNHPFVIGELACGNLRNRLEILSSLAALPSASVAAHEEVLRFVTQRKLHGKGLGWVDVHLLASSLLTGCALWTRDKGLAAAAAGLKLSV
jgi:predicted nucleic acid-binding protein